MIPLPVVCKGVSPGEPPFFPVSTRQEDFLTPLLTPTDVLWDWWRIGYRELKDIQTEKKERGQFITLSAADGELVLAQEVLCSL